MSPGQPKSSATTLRFFSAYTTTVPVVDGSQFKFIVDGELMTSSDHPTKYDFDAKTENNVVATFHYIFDGDGGRTKAKRVALVNSLSLSNPAIRQSILGKPAAYVRLRHGRRFRRQRVQQRRLQ